MGNINITDILKRIPNRFLLSNVVAKRARQIQEGAKPLIAVNKNEPLIPVLIALEEIQAGLIEVVLHDEKEKYDEELEKLDQLLDAELEKEPKEEESSSDDKKKTKESKNKKSKSLAA